MKFSYHTFFIMQDGTVKCCGRNDYGELGLGHANSPVSTVTELPFTGVKDIVCGAQHTFFIMEDGSIKCCGRNSYGQLGLGHKNNPVSTVTNLPFTGVKDIVCSTYHTFFIMQDDTVKCCGHNQYGQLGLGHANHPVSTVTDLPITGVKSIVCGLYHTFFIMKDDTVKCCGQNSQGQLGLGHTNTPVSTVTNLPLTGVKNIVCGSDHTFFIMGNGTVKCCGRNQHGQLGLGHTNTPVSTVTNLPLTGVKNIVCGNSHTFFIMQDGTVKCCGDNQHGQLGLGHTNTPVSTVTNLPLTGVKDITCGYSHTFFIMEDGSVKCCGYNSDGQLGLGHTNTPVSTVTDLPFTGVKDFAKYSSIIDIIKFIIHYLGKNYSLDDNGFFELSNELTAETFTKYGIDDISSIPESQWKQFNDEIILFSFTNTGRAPIIKKHVDTFKPIKLRPLSVSVWTDSDLELQMVQEVPDTEIFYAISMDNATYHAYKNNEWAPVTDIYYEGMTKEQINALTRADFDKIFTPGNLYIKAVLKTNDEHRTPSINNVIVRFPESYTTGQFYIITDSGMQLNTLDWAKINSCTIEQTMPEGTEIKYLFSNDNKNTWKVYRNGAWVTTTLDNINIDGMTKEEVEALASDEWDGILYETLDVAIMLSSTSISVSPEVDQITFDYDQIPSPVISNDINIPVPEVGFRFVLQPDDAYELKIAEGLAFDDPEIDYNFYTSPDGVILRSLNMGQLVGGTSSLVHAVEVINGFDNMDFTVTLRVSQSGIWCENDEEFAYLNDASEKHLKTRIGLSLTMDPFNAEYPLVFDLPRDSKRLVYIKMYPTFTKAVLSNFQVRLSALPK